MNTVIIVIIATLVGAGSAWYSHVKNGPIEEACEAIIENELHLPAGIVELSDANYPAP